jgi:phosphate-selective porin OprO/OprP
MTNSHRISVAALAVACGWAMPAQAQSADAAAIQQELAAMRAQMMRMAERIDTLEDQLEAAEAKAEAATAASASAVEVASAAARDEPVKVSWKGAPEFEGTGGWSFKPRGRFNYDAGFVSAPGSTGADDGFGSEARRIRLGVEGDIPGGFGYKFEADFAGNAVEVTDAILTYKDGGLTVSAGQHNSFQSLEELSSSRFTSFIERAAFTDAFGFGRRVGLSAEYAQDAVLVQGGLFTDNMENLPNKAWSADGRVVFMPRAGDTRFHVGGSLHYRELNDAADTVRYRQRPFVHFTGERFINTGAFSAEKEFGIGVEGAAIAGPLHAAAEGYWQKVSRPGALADPTFFGGYVEVGYFLTAGDTRGYKKGVFDRVKPENPVGEGGIGAIQVNARYDHLDLNDAGIVGGRQNGYQFSLIWTPTDYTRFMLNYGHMKYGDAVLPAAGGDTSYGVDAFGARAQVDF